MMYSELQAKIPQIDEILLRVTRSIRAGLDAVPMVDWAEDQLKSLGDEESRAAAMVAVTKLAKIAEEGRNHDNQ